MKHVSLIVLGVLVLSGCIGQNIKPTAPDGSGFSLSDRLDAAERRAMEYHLSLPE